MAVFPRFAILGGTFDPPHAGHREIILGLCERPGIHEFLVLPAGNPRLKGAPPSATPEHRVQMLEILLEDLKTGVHPKVASLRIDDREIRRARLTGEPTRTKDTVLELRQELGTPFAWVIGTDQFAQFHAWHSFRELLDLCHWIVLDRRGVPSDQRDTALRQLKSFEQSGLLKPLQTQEDSGTWLSSGGKTTLQWLPTSARALSSTEIRLDLARSGNQSPRLATDLPSKLVDYLKSNSLYGTGPDA